MQPRSVPLLVFFVLGALLSAGPSFSQDPVIRNLGIDGEIVAACGKQVVLHSGGQLLVYNTESGAVVETGNTEGQFFLRRGAIRGDLEFCGDKWFGFAVSEGGGGRDLNGDGDVGDRVLHVLDLETHVTTNLELAGPPPIMSEHWLAFRVNERDQGNRDLNGDGDEDDHVLYVLDLETDVTTNLELAASALRMSEHWLAFTVDERGQGDGDLNGDGDEDDHVLYVLDLETGVTTNLAFAVHSTLGEWQEKNFDEALPQWLQVSENWLAFAVSERHQGNLDLNGDGDKDDSVLHVLDLETDVTTNLKLAPWYTYVTAHGLVFMVDEQAQGNEDLDGDGQADWYVFHVVRFEDMVPRNLRLAPFGFSCFLDIPCSTMTLSGRVVWLLATERRLHVYDVQTGILANVGRNNEPLRVGAHTYGEPVATSGKWCAFWADEWFAGEDLNSDGDESDLVLHLYDLDAKEKMNLGLAGSYHITASGEWLAFGVNENSHGMRDLDGNDWGGNSVVHLVHLESRTTFNLGLPISFSGVDAPRMLFAGDALVISVPEHKWAIGRDLNDDGDLDDSVIHVVDLQSLEPSVPFLRADCNDDGTVDISDAVFTLESLFLGEGDPSCADACDSNDDGEVDISDTLNTLGVLFLGNGIVPLPGMKACGVDPTDDEVGCDRFERCPKGGRPEKD